MIKLGFLESVEFRRLLLSPKLVSFSAAIYEAHHPPYPAVDSVQNWTEAVSSQGKLFSICHNLSCRERPQFPLDSELSLTGLRREIDNKTPCWTFQSTALHLVPLLPPQEAEPWSTSTWNWASCYQFSAFEWAQQSLPGRQTLGSHREGSLETLQQICMCQIRAPKILAMKCTFTISCPHPHFAAINVVFFVTLQLAVRPCAEVHVGSNRDI